MQMVSRVQSHSPLLGHSLYFMLMVEDVLSQLPVQPPALILPCHHGLSSEIISPIKSFSPQIVLVMAFLPQQHERN